MIAHIKLVVPKAILMPLVNVKRPVHHTAAEKTSFQHTLAHLSCPVCLYGQAMCGGMTAWCMVKLDLMVCCTAVKHCG